jgi:hypothetical protein
MGIHKGLDVSYYDDRRWYGTWKYDRPTDWDKAATAGLGEFVIVKSSEGLSRDPGYLCQRAAIGNQRPCAHYHLIRANINPVYQAKLFIDTIYPYHTEALDTLMVDFETTDGQTGATCLKNLGLFFNELDKQGFSSTLYTYPYHWKTVCGEAVKDFKCRPLIISEWHWDNWLSVLRLPPYSFRLDRVNGWLSTIDYLADQPYAILTKDQKQYQPTPLAPWYSADNPDWYMGWQLTARMYSSDVPGYPAIKKVVDVNYLTSPWWVK